MMPDEIAVAVENLGKRFTVYRNPSDRLAHMVIPPLQRLAGRPPSTFRTEFWALRKVSFQVRRGETVGIIGRNGSGKSTLLQIICGTQEPSEGTVRTSGRIGALLELGAGFNPDFTGRENVFLNGHILGLDRREIEERFDEIAAFADIGAFMDLPVKAYSSGMFVRLAFAVQACVEPDLLIVDEALAVGDEKFQRKCYTHIDALRERGCAVLLVTHAAATVERFCSRAILLDQGRLIALGAARPIIDQYHALLFADEKTYLKRLNTEPDAPAQPAAPAAPQPAPDPEGSDGTRQRARITRVTVEDAAGRPAELFRAGETLTIVIAATADEDLPEVQAGMSLKTVEGVVAFGTSTSYHGHNLHDVRAGQGFEIRFGVRADLCAGSYFLSAAIAMVVADNRDMVYLDRKIDIGVIRVVEPHLLATGIAHLQTTLSVAVSDPPAGLQSCD